MLKSKTVCNKMKITHHGKDVLFDKLSSYNNPKNNSITFLSKFSDSSYNKIINQKDIFLILPSNISKIFKSNAHAYCFSDNPKHTFFQIAELYLNTSKQKSHISQSASVSSSVEIGSNVFIDKNAIVEGDCIIGDNVYIGKNTIITGKCVIGHNTYLGSNVLLGGSSLSVKYTDSVPSQNIQMGGIKIGENCRIGMNSSVSRGTIDNTVIMNDVLMGEYVHIGHNAQISNNCVFTIRSTICGSVNVRENCWFGPHSLVLSQVEVGKNIKLASNSVLYSNVSREGTYLGNPAKFFNI
jgi:UDP-3-O-[3-hydroxymyristoyl] glucosamine N-acyltransferase